MPPSNHRLTRGQLAILGIILAVGAFVRLYRIDGPSLWMDEIWSIEISTGRGSAHDHLAAGVIQTQQVDLTDLAGAPHWWHILSHLSGVPNAPLYHVALRWWMDLLGNGPLATRLLSAIFSWLAIALLFDICRFLHGPRIALLAAALMAIAPAQLDFAQQTRSYSMLVALGLLAGDLLVRIEIFGATRRRLVLLAIALIAVPLTHYLTLGALAALLVYAMIRLRGRDRVLTVATFAIAAAITLALWGVPFYRQMHSLPASRPTYLYEDDPHHASNTFRRVIGLAGQLIAGESAAAQIAPAVLILLAALIYLLPALRLPVLRLPAARLGTRPDLLLWLLWLAGTILPLIIADLLHGSIFLGYLRYSILASPAAYALLASVDWPGRPLLRDCLALIAITLTAFFCVQRLSEPPKSVEDFRGLTATIHASAAPDDLLVYYGDNEWISPGTWALAYGYYYPQARNPWLVLHHPAGPRLLAQLRSMEQQKVQTQQQVFLWLIGYAPATDGPFVLPGWRSTQDFQNSAGAVCRMSRMYPVSTRPASWRSVSSGSVLDRSDSTR